MRQRIARAQRAPRPRARTAARRAGSGRRRAQAAGALAEAKGRPTPPSPPVGGSGGVGRAEPPQNVAEFPGLNPAGPRSGVVGDDRPAELAAADDTAAILRAVAMVCWRAQHGPDADLADDRQPAISDLEEFLRSGRCPDDALAEASALLADLMGGAGWGWRLLLDVGLAGVKWLDSGAEFRDVRQVHAGWLAGREASRRHPLAPLVSALLSATPPTVEPDWRRDVRIVPHRLVEVVGRHPARQEGARLFGGLLDGRAPEADTTLPLWPAPARYRVPLLDLSEAAGAPLRNPGHGAPLDLRLLVQAVLAVRREDRGREAVRMAVSVGDLLDGLYPRRGKRPQRRLAQHWPKIEAALMRLRDYVVPDEADGRWFIAALRRMPSAHGVLPASLDSLVLLDVSLPPAWSPNGPPVSLPWLIEAGVRSGPEFRAYIAAQTLLWQPGTTRRPLPGKRKPGQPSRWGWSRTPADYPVLTADDFRHLTFGRGDTKNRTHTDLVKPWEKLPAVRLDADATDPRTGAVGWRLLADTCGESDDTCGESDDTCGESDDICGEK